MSLKELRGALSAADQPGPNAEPWRQKAFAEEWIGRAIDAIEGEGRQPDDWESEFLATALGAVVSRQYFLAVAVTMKAMAPPEERVEEWRGTDKGVPLRDLRDGLAYVTGMAARAF